jgi:hypothetical protein
MSITIEFDGEHFNFYLDGGREAGPALPLKRAGRYPSMGWDIDNYWAIDANDQTWMDNGGHGTGMQRCSLPQLLDSMESESDGGSDELRRSLGMKPRLPEWIKTALRAGWTPPATFDRGAYDEG